MSPLGARAVRDGGEHGEFWAAGGVVGVGDHGYPVRAGRQGAQRPVGVAEVDGGGAPVSDRGGGAEHEQRGRAAQPGAEGGEVDRPAPVFAGVAAQLHLHHDGQHRGAGVDGECHHRVGPVLGGDQVQTSGSSTAGLLRLLIRLPGAVTKFEPEFIQFDRLSRQQPQESRSS